MASADAPASLPNRLPLAAFAPGEAWHRIHRSTQPPLHFGPSPGSPPLNRFDAPGGEYRALYLGLSLSAAFVETLVRNPQIPFVERSEVEARSASLLANADEVRLVDLRGAGLSRIGADGRVATGPYEISRRWALALWRHGDRADGLLYRSRHDPKHFCAVVFDRRRPAFEVRSTTRLIDVPHRWAPILSAHGKGLV